MILLSNHSSHRSNRCRKAKNTNHPSCKQIVTRGKPLRHRETVHFWKMEIVQWFVVWCFVSVKYDFLEELWLWKWQISSLSWAMFSMWIAFYQRIPQVCMPMATFWGWRALIKSKHESTLPKIAACDCDAICAVRTVYPKKYAHGFCFAVLCCGYTLTDFPMSIRLTSLALWQSNDCPSASKATLMNMDKYFTWIHYERFHNHNKAKHNKTVCIFLGIYCNSALVNPVSRSSQQRGCWLSENNSKPRHCGVSHRIAKL